MGKRKNKRKAKPSSSGEDSIIEEKEQSDKHLQKKVKTNIMAESKEDISLFDIMSRMDALENSLREDFKKTVNSLTLKYDKLESEVYQLYKDRDSLLNRNQALKNENCDLREMLNNQGNTIRELEQYIRRDNVKVYGLSEKRIGNKGETEEETAKAVVDMVKAELNYELKPSDISIAHRLGAKTPGKERSVIVKFVSRTVRNEVVKRRKALKGKPVVISDDLSPYYQGLFTKLRDKVGKKNVWSSGSQIFVKTQEGIKRVNSENFDHVFAHVSAQASDRFDACDIVFGDMDPTPAMAALASGSRATPSTCSPGQSGQRGVSGGHSGGHVGAGVDTVTAQ